MALTWPCSFALHSFLFQSQFDIKEDYCYWELSSVIVPTARYLEYLEKEAEREKELKAKEKEKGMERSEI